MLFYFEMKHAHQANELVPVTVVTVKALVHCTTLKFAFVATSREVSAVDSSRDLTLVTRQEKLLIRGLYSTISLPDQGCQLDSFTEITSVYVALFVFLAH